MKQATIALLCVLASSNVHAAEWDTAIWVGLTHSNSASTTVKVGSATAGPIDSTGTSAFNLGAEYFRRTEAPVNLTIILDDTWLGNKDTKNDFAMSLLVGPRVETKTPINFWAEITGGPSLITFGTTSATSGGLTATFNSGSAWSFVFSPRVGFDYKLDNKYFIGLQAAYYTGSVSIDGKYSGSLNASFTEDSSVHFFSTALRFGYSLGEDAPKSETAPTPSPAPAMEHAATPSPAPEAAKGLDADELIKLKKLKDAGVLTDEEYKERKAKLLNQ